MFMKKNKIISSITKKGGQHNRSKYTVRYTKYFFKPTAVIKLIKFCFSTVLIQGLVIPQQSTYNICAKILARFLQ